jgi:hypothetical protein
MGWLGKSSVRPSRLARVAVVMHSKTPPGFAFISGREEETYVVERETIPDPGGPSVAAWREMDRRWRELLGVLS